MRPADVGAVRGDDHRPGAGAGDAARRGADRRLLALSTSAPNWPSPASTDAGRLRHRHQPRGVRVSRRAPRRPDPDLRHHRAGDRAYVRPRSRAARRRPDELPAVQRPARVQGRARVMRGGDRTAMRSHPHVRREAGLGADARAASRLRRTASRSARSRSPHRPTRRRSRRRSRSRRSRWRPRARSPARTSTSTARSPRRRSVRGRSSRFHDTEPGQHGQHEIEHRRRHAGDEHFETSEFVAVAGERARRPRRSVAPPAAAVARSRRSGSCSRALCRARRQTHQIRHLLGVGNVGVGGKGVGVGHGRCWTAYGAFGRTMRHGRDGARPGGTFDPAGTVRCPGRRCCVPAGTVRCRAGTVLRPGRDDVMSPVETTSRAAGLWPSSRSAGQRSRSGQARR